MPSNTSYKKFWVGLLIKFLFPSRDIPPQSTSFQAVLNENAADEKIGNMYVYVHGLALIVT